MMTFIIAIFINSCAAIDIKPVPLLENRTLRLSADSASAEYQYQVCSKTFLGKCRKAEFHKDLYDLSDPVVRKTLIDKGFVLKVREKINP